MHCDMNNMKKIIEIFRNVFRFHHKVTIKERIISFFTKYWKWVLAVLILVIAIVGFIVWTNRTKPILYHKYSPQEINMFWEMQESLYYDPVDYLLFRDTATIVDIRSAERFKEEHMLGAVNIPIELEKEDLTRIKDQKRVIEEFKKLGNKKEIVIYGENNYSLTPIKTASLLARNNVPVRIMKIGWNEFRHFPTFWLPEQLWNKANIYNFIESNEL